MANTFDFTPFDRQLLKLAAESAGMAAKACKKAAQKAYLTEAESEAHAMEGYADEAVRFLNNPEGIAEESAGAEATEAEKREVVQLMFGHRAALRAGCLIRIKDAEKIAEDQSEIFAATDGTDERIKDFRRLESLLRGMNSDQGELPFRGKPDAPEAPGGDGAALETASEPPLADEPLGPFDAPAAREPLALPAPITPDDDETDADHIADAEFEILDGDEGTDIDVAADFSFDEPVLDSDVDSTSAGDPLDDAAREAWLNEPLRTDPATPDDLLA